MVAKHPERPPAWRPAAQRCRDGACGPATKIEEEKVRGPPGCPTLPHLKAASLTSRFSWEPRTSWAPTQSREAARSLAHRSASDWAKSSSPEILARADAALSDAASFFLAMTLAASKLAPAAK